MAYTPNGHIDIEHWRHKYITELMMTQLTDTFMCHHRNKLFLPV